jgi:hypothetical protein
MACKTLVISEAWRGSTWILDQSMQGILAFRDDCRPLSNIPIIIFLTPEAAKP